MKRSELLQRREGSGRQSKLWTCDWAVSGILAYVLFASVGPSTGFAQQPTQLTAGSPLLQTVLPGATVTLRALSSSQSPDVISFAVVSGGAVITNQSTAFSSGGEIGTATVAAGSSLGSSVITANCVIPDPDGDQSCGSVTFTIVVGVAEPKAEVQSALRSYSALTQAGLAAASVQITNVQNRIRQRRGGFGGGISLYGAALNNGRQVLSGGAMQSLVDTLSGNKTPMNALDNRREVVKRLRSPGSVVYLADEDLKSAGGDPSQRLGIFINGQGSIGTQDTTANETGFRAQTAGLTAGADYRFTDNFIFGAAVGYLRTRSDFYEAVGQAKTQGFSFSLFGTYHHKNGFYIDSIANFGLNYYDTDRNVSSNGAIAKSNTKGTQGGVSITAGYDVNRQALSFGPYVRATYLRSNVRGFDESGGGGADLQMDSTTLNSLTTDVGLQAAFAISTSWGVLSPSAKIEWEHQYADSSRLLTGSLVIDPQQQIFAVPTDDPDRNYFNVGVGLAAQFAHGRSAFVSYETVIGRSNTSNHAATLGVRMEF